MPSTCEELKESSECEKENRNGGNLARSLHYGPEEGRGGGGKFRSSGGRVVISWFLWHKIFKG